MILFMIILKNSSETKPRWSNSSKTSIGRKLLWVSKFQKHN